MRLTGRLCVPLAEQTILTVDDDAAHARVRVGEADRVLGQAQGLGHPTVVARHRRVARGVDIGVDIDVVGGRSDFFHGGESSGATPGESGAGPGGPDR